MNISVVLCTYQRAAQLQAALESLAALRVPHSLRWELIVVDNGSTDGTREIVHRAATRLPCRYLREPRLGKSFALNAGVGAATGDIIAFTDDDVSFHPEWLTALWRTFTTHDCAAAGGRIVPVWATPRPDWYGRERDGGMMAGVVVDHDWGDETRVIDTLPFGANMAIRREAFLRFGDFRTDLGPQGARLMRGEDTELCARIRAGGGLVLYAADAVVYHPVSVERMRKRYFASWYYHFGRMQVLLLPERPAAKLWFGVPRYLIREAAEIAMRSLTDSDARQRFLHRLHCWRLIGQIVEYHRRPIGGR